MPIETEIVTEGGINRAQILQALRTRVEADGEGASRAGRFLSADATAILAWLEGRRKPRRATLERVAAFLQGRP